jgi:uncharacterized protein YbbC (DUF1343 family)
MKTYLVFLIFAINVCAAALKTGAEGVQSYLPSLKDKRVAMVVNQSSMVGENHLVDLLLKKGIKVKTIFAPEHGFRGKADAGEQINHLVDLLLEKGIKVKTIFAPEHGFRGKADAGEQIKDGVDKKSGLPIVSLYGKHKKPTPDDLKGVNVIVFDIQDVGVRFYTYLSTLHYVLEAAAEGNIPVIVLDRPNPNANRIDGPLLKKEFSSFVGLHPVPILYGMTIGEYAQMINGEGWLKNGIKADLTVVALQNYSHNSFYHLPIKPSPNLPNDLSIALYPSLALFEGTVISAGRGTTKQFQLYGAPKYTKGAFSFIPEPRDGAKYPKHKGKVCYGVDLSTASLEVVHSSEQMSLDYLLDAYRNYSDKEKFFRKRSEQAGTKV